MPWWVIVYLIVLVALSAGGLADDARDRKPGSWLGMAVVSALSSIVLVLAYWDVLPPSIPPLVLFAALALAVLFDALSAISDLRADVDEPGLSPAGNARIRVLGVCLGIVLLLPAYAWGFLAAMRG